MTAKKHKLPGEVAALLGRQPLFSRGGLSHSLVWHSLGSTGEPWPHVLRAYKNACGVYAIKESGRVVYVGSSKRQLYDTITRHFQQWKRTPKGRRAAKYNYHRTHETEHDPGMVYQRGRCQVALYTVACGDELEEEARLIAKLRPRDNITDPSGTLEDAPF